MLQVLWRWKIYKKKTSFCRKHPKTWTINTSLLKILVTPPSIEKPRCHQQKSMIISGCSKLHVKFLAQRCFFGDSRDIRGSNPKGVRGKKITSRSVWRGVYWGIFWVVPPPSNSDHQDYYILPYKPSFATVTGRGDNPRYLAMTLDGISLLINYKLVSGYSTVIPMCFLWFVEIETAITTTNTFHNHLCPILQLILGTANTHVHSLVKIKSEAKSKNIVSPNFSGT